MKHSFECLNLHPMATSNSIQRFSDDKVVIIFMCYKCNKKQYVVFKKCNESQILTNDKEIEQKDFIDRIKTIEEEIKCLKDSSDPRKTNVIKRLKKELDKMEDSKNAFYTRSTEEERYKEIFLENV